MQETRSFRYDNDNGTQAGKDQTIPTPDHWIKKSPRDMKRIKVRFDGAREVMVNVMQQEYENLEKRLDALKVEKASAGIMEYLFGKSSQFANVMRRLLEMTKDELDQFMGTFFVATEWSQPAKRLKKKERFRYKGCMSQGALNQLWRKIGAPGKNDAQAVHLWKELEDALNKDCRELFLTEGEGQTIKIFIALDNDKVWFQFSTASVQKDKDYLCGAK